ncbi:MAG: hypothetical protein ACMG57_01305 [Candidatus Dojkabacteria bacterium]
MSYFQTDEKDLETISPIELTTLYNEGFVLTRKNRGNLIQTRSLRVRLSEFELNSENRRILGKNTDLTVSLESLPFVNYNWQIHNLGKSFYVKRFGDGTMSASKIKEMFNETDKSNMNTVFVYKYQNSTKEIADGYALSYKNDKIIHYAYPFYDLEIPKEKNLGMAMMINAINFAKTNDKEFIYLGSVVEKKSLYKLQFNGLEWFNTDSKNWETDLEKLKLLVESTDTN